jgi:hypothetical protein
MCCKSGGLAVQYGHVDGRQAIPCRVCPRGCLQEAKAGRLQHPAAARNALWLASERIPRMPSKTERHVFEGILESLWLMLSGIAARQGDIFEQTRWWP